MANSALSRAIECPPPHIRPARRIDCRAIAELFLIASDGLARYIWRQADSDGLPLLEVGARRYAREGVAFSYQNCLVAEVDGEVAGLLHSFAMKPPATGEDEAEPDPVLAPYSELEDYGSLYISAVAVFDQYRGQGIGSKLLSAAQRRAASMRLPRLSLICFEGNRNAMRLYQRLGYREQDRRQIVPHPWLRYRDGDAVLLVRPVADFFRSNQSGACNAQIQT